MVRYEGFEWDWLNLREMERDREKEEVG